MPTINITGNSGDNTPNGTTNPNFLRGSESDLRRSTAAVLGRQRRFDTMHDKADREDFRREKAHERRWDNIYERAEWENFRRDQRTIRRWESIYERAEREDFQREQRTNKKWENVYERAEREDFQREQRTSKKWSNIHEQAQREDFRWEQKQATKKQKDLARINIGLEKHITWLNKLSNPTYQHQRGRYGANLGSGLNAAFGGRRDFAGRPRGFLGRLGNFGGTVSEAGGFGEAMAMGALGPLGIAAIAGIDIAKDAYGAPSKVSNVLNNLMGTASPYTNFLQTSSGIANMGGNDAGTLRDMLYSNHGKATPQWMSQLGLGAKDVFSMYGAYGARGDAAGDIRGISIASANAAKSAYLGGFSNETYARGVGNFTNLTGAGYTTASGNNQSMGDVANSYFSRMQNVMQAATTWGLDHSKVWQTTNSLLSSVAMSGGANVSVGKTTDFWSRMASGGLASMRDGSGVLQAQQSLANLSGSGGIGGNAIQTMAVQSYVGSHGGMKGLSTKAGFNKFFGVNYSNLSPAAQAEANDVMQAARRGDAYGLAGSMGPFLQSDPGLQQNITAAWTSQAHLPQYLADQINGVQEGSLGTAISGRVGTNLPPGTATLFKGNMPKFASDALFKASEKFKVDPKDLIAISGIESTYGTNIRDSSKGAVGLMQITPIALKQTQDDGDIPRSWTMDDIRSDANKNAMVSAAYWKWLKPIAHGNKTLMAEMYNGGPSFNPANKGVQDYGSTFAANRAALGNNNTQVNTLLSRQQQLGMQSAEQAYNTAGATYGQDGGDVIQAFTGNIVGASKAVTDFATTLQHWARNLISSPTGSAGHAPIVPTGGRYGHGRPQPSQP